MNNQSLKYHSLGKSNAMHNPVTIMLSAINRLFQACKSKTTLASYKKLHVSLNYFNKMWNKAFTIF
jgi:hypothetical protein